MTEQVVKGLTKLNWLAPLPINSCVGAIANSGQWEQGCNLYMSTDLGPVRATCRKKEFFFNVCKQKST